MEEKIKNIDKDPSLTPEQKEKAKEEAKKEAEKVKKSIEEGKTTEWVDEKGNPIKPVTPGTYPAGSTPNYELVGTVTNPETGDRIHVFTPVPVVNNITEWVDTEGKVIRPKEEGSQPAGKVPSYELVGTVKDPETGKVLHIFKPSTKKPVTVWVDVNGKPLKPLAEGDNPAGEIPGYALVDTIKVEGTGNVIYVFKRTTNGRPQKEGSTNGGSLIPSQPGSPARPSTNPTSPVKPTDPSQPATPVVPRDPSQPTTPANSATPAAPANPTTPANPAAPAMPSAPVNGEAPQAPAASSEAKGQAELPNTGTADNAILAALGLLGVLSGFGLVARKKKED